MIVRCTRIYHTTGKNQRGEIFNKMTVIFWEANPQMYPHVSRAAWRGRRRRRHRRRLALTLFLLLFLGSSGRSSSGEDDEEEEEEGEGHIRAREEDRRTTNNGGQFISLRVPKHENW